MCQDGDSSSESNVVDQPSRNDSEFPIANTIGVTLIIAALIAAMALFFNPTLPLLTNALTPPGNPIPGSRFGGALPVGVPNSMLNLVPPKLIPMAAFPPFAAPRTLEAESIIFAEDPDIFQFIVKRSSGRKRPKSIFSFYNWIKNLLRNVKCLRTRLFVLGHEHFLRNIRRKSSFLPQNQSIRLLEEDIINSMDDCIEGIAEPLYGFRANVILLKDFPCILGVTCNSPSFSGN